MKVEIIFYMVDNTPLFFDYDKIQLAAEQKEITVEEQIMRLRNSVNVIERFFSIKE
jgi:hypothetical protein